MVLTSVMTPASVNVRTDGVATGTGWVTLPVAVTVLERPVSSENSRETVTLVTSDGVPVSKYGPMIAVAPALIRIGDDGETSARPPANVNTTLLTIAVERPDVSVA